MKSSGMGITKNGSFGYNSISSSGGILYTNEMHYILYVAIS
jgi:hypothetical protein